MPRPEQRSNPEALPLEALLPSQRALLALNEPYKQYSFSGLSTGALNQLGELLAYEVTMAIDERLSARISEDSPGEKEYRDGQIQALGLLAGHLLEYEDDLDPYRGMTEHQRNSCRIDESLDAKVTVMDQDFFHYSDSYRPRSDYFTPQGWAIDPIGTVQQKAIQIDINRKSLFAEDAYFNFSTKGHLYLYTDNLSAELPFWEYHSRYNNPDILPSSRHEPYYMHAVPPRFSSEELALSAIEAIGRTFATSSREAREKAAEQAARHQA